MLVYKEIIIIWSELGIVDNEYYQRQGKGTGTRKHFQTNIDENFPNLRNELELGIQEVNGTPKTHCIKMIKNR